MTGMNSRPVQQRIIFAQPTEPVRSPEVIWLDTSSDPQQTKVYSAAADDWQSVGVTDYNALNNTPTATESYGSPDTTFDVDSYSGTVFRFDSADPDKVFSLTHSVDGAKLDSASTYLHLDETDGNSCNWQLDIDAVANGSTVNTITEIGTLDANGLFSNTYTITFPSFFGDLVINYTLTLSGNTSYNSNVDFTVGTDATTTYVDQHSHQL